MRKALFIVSIFFATLCLQAAPLTEARQGCCSHHGGVCGCGCCDGTSLSATCAPYYPQCSGGGRAVTKSCPAHARLIGGSCICDQGYAAYGSSCILIPANAHAVQNGSDAWKCDAGYEEVGNGCRALPVVAVPISSASVSTSSAFSSSPTFSEVPLPPPAPKEVVPPKKDSEGLAALIILGIGGYIWWHIKKVKA